MFWSKMVQLTQMLWIKKELGNITKMAYIKACYWSVRSARGSRSNGIETIKHGSIDTIGHLGK